MYRKHDFSSDMYGCTVVRIYDAATSIVTVTLHRTIQPFPVPVTSHIAKAATSKSWYSSTVYQSNSSYLLMYLFLVGPYSQSTLLSVSFARAMLLLSNTRSILHF
ncbi:uncharacterized protein YALI1_B15703g [Yarrowia lipolytica]|uniref:Uncharacterized protein n=1 Tax=Yarrowia lipolytica TaxID=4952 RepID=A0A1D8N7F9_YARLL|nr:hypothetical protein YALI1_B15703g [Yarrowia lipolytica]